MTPIGAIIISVIDGEGHVVLFGLVQSLCWQLDFVQLRSMLQFQCQGGVGIEAGFSHRNWSFALPDWHRRPENSVVISTIINFG